MLILEDLLTGVCIMRPRIGRALARLEVHLGLFDAVDRIDWEVSRKRKRRVQRESAGPDTKQLALGGGDN